MLLDERDVHLRPSVILENYPIAQVINLLLLLIMYHTHTPENPAGNRSPRARDESGVDCTRQRYPTRRLSLL